MAVENDLLSLRLPDVAEFSISGPMPRFRPSSSPALARTLLQCTNRYAELRVLSEAVPGGSSASTIPFLFEQTAYYFNLVFQDSSNSNIRLLLRGTDLLAGRRRLGSQQAYVVPVNFQSEIGFTDIEAWQGSVRIFSLRLEVFPTKLDYRTDLLELRADLQMEVRSLVFELYGRTFQMLRRGAGGRSNDIEWLTLLRGEFEKLTHALDTIVR